MLNVSSLLVESRISKVRKNHERAEAIVYLKTKKNGWTFPTRIGSLMMENNARPKVYVTSRKIADDDDGFQNYGSKF